MSPGLVGYTQSVRLILLPIRLLFLVLFFPFRLIRRRRACPPGGFVELHLQGTVQEGPSRPTTFRDRLQRRLRGSTSKLVRVIDVQVLLDLIVADPKVGGVLVNLGPVAGGWASLTALRDQLRRVSAAGKKLVVFADEGLDTKGYFLATAADQIVAPRTVDVVCRGVSSPAVFLRDTMAKAGVTFEVEARKEFKSAGDRFTRISRSAEDRLQTEEIIKPIYEHLIAALMEGRKIDRERAIALMDLGPSRAVEAVEAGLIDVTTYDHELRTFLKAKIISARSYFSARKARKRLFGQKVIGIVEVHGAIASGQNALIAPGATSERIVAELRLAESDSSVAAIVLDINSPGGTITASDAIWAAAKRLAGKKPLVVRFSDVAASGGYYIAMAGATIFAHPLTITGSIGVVGMRPVAAVLAERLGLVREVLSMGRFADEGDIMRAPTDDERALTSQQIDHHYGAFVAHVADGRKRNIDDIEPLARGRVYTGEAALKLGLVDQLGGLKEAITFVRAQVPRPLAELPVVIRAEGPAPRPVDPVVKAALALLPTAISTYMSTWLMLGTLSPTPKVVALMEE